MIPLSSFTYMMLERTGREVPCMIEVNGRMEGYGMPPYDILEMFILCPMIAQMLRGE